MQAFSGTKNTIDILTPNASKGQNGSKKSVTSKNSDFLSMVLNATVNKSSNGIEISKNDIKDIVKSVAMQSDESQKLDFELNTKIANEIATKLDDATRAQLYENANFMQLLQVLEILNGQERVSKFPDFSSKIANFLSISQNVEELKNVKNINELLDLANKFDLGLENIKITKDDTIKLAQMFKNLNDNEFFTSPQQLQPSNISNSVNLELKNKVEQVLEHSKTNEQSVTKLNELLTQVVNNADRTSQVKQSIQKDAPLEQILPDEKPVKEALIKEALDKNLSQTTKEQPKEQKINLQTLLYPDRQSGNEQDSQRSFSQNDQNQDMNAMVRDIVKNAQSQVQNRLTTQTLSNFTQDLAEQIQNYKAPFTRVNITLNPLNLGEVEVTMLSRGNNLHVNFNSTTNTMNIFLQHQAEFKANLINMGFTELQMNFSDQSQKQQEHSKKTYKNLNGEFSSDENDEPQMSSLELILPRYA